MHQPFILACRINCCSPGAVGREDFEDGLAREARHRAPRARAELSAEEAAETRSEDPVFGRCPLGHARSLLASQWPFSLEVVGSSQQVIFGGPGGASSA